MDLKLSELFDLKQTEYSDWLKQFVFPWEVVEHLPELLATLKPSIGNTNVKIHPTALLEGDITVYDDVEIGPYAYLQGPIVIGSGSRIGFGANIRPYSVIGKKCIVGHSTETKQCFIFNSAILPHFNYVGDSVLGYKVHLGGGATLANFKSDGSTIKINHATEKIDTGLRKFGSAVGDNTEIGGNSTLNPGTVVGKNCSIYAGVTLRGCIPNNSIVKLRQEQEIVTKS